MGFYDDVVLPHVIEFACGMKLIEPERAKTAAALTGTVLEIGFGSALNLPHYPKSVTRVLGVDPSERARKIGRKRIDALHCPVEIVGLDAERIALNDGVADSAIATFTLCTVPEAEQAMREVRRILKPGGRFYFLEHGRSPKAGIARWQDRLNGAQRFMCGGCNINRDIPAVIKAAGFQIEALETTTLPGPPTHGFVYRGAAAASA
jgi:ubiquinone/menaquinone biosynthesis C-methylase UbiE